tara:strand:+ start:450 stop:1352 length:903 start_codon:yes stop_codon:yes gene_type:complete
MNINVKVKRRKDPGLVEIDEGDGNPVLYTRVWMGIVPPKGLEAGYCAVVGELFDDDPRQKPRPKILLDEGQSLNPKDFPNETVERYRDLFYTDIGDPLEDDDFISATKASNPTLHDLRGAAVALKDLYRVEMGIALPSEPPFTAFLRATEGLCIYDDAIDPAQYQSWFPTFTSIDHRMAIMDEVPMGEDEEYGRQLVETLLARNELHVNDHCKLFQNSHLAHPVRAVGLVCAAMQVWDWSYMVRDVQVSDGYEEIVSDEEIEEARAETAEEDAVRMWQAGLNPGFSEMEQKHLTSYLSGQ